MYIDATMALRDAAARRGPGAAAVRRRHPDMLSYLGGVMLGALVMLAALIYALVGLGAAGALPPPQFSNNLCIDEKLAGMRVAPPQRPDLLVIGSSVAWRHFNAPAALAVAPGLRPYNAGFCGARLDQTEKVARWLTGRLPTVRRVVLVASPFDFQGCSTHADSHFDVAAADRFVFDGASPARFYARYFDPVTLARNATSVGAARRDIGGPDPLVQDRFGDGPSEPRANRGLFYDRGEAFDPVCFAALHRMALALHRQGQALDVTITPLHPDWAARYGDPRLAAGVAAALQGTGARFHPAVHTPDVHSFYDAIHMRWSGTAAYTRALVRTVGA